VGIGVLGGPWTLKLDVGRVQLNLKDFCGKMHETVHLNRRLFALSDVVFSHRQTAAKVSTNHSKSIHETQ
jgi:hypothetical protein